MTLQFVKSKLILIVWMLAIPVLVVVGATDAFQKPDAKSLPASAQVVPPTAPTLPVEPSIPDAKRVGNGAAIETPESARGRALFAKQCAICHGDQGDGAGKFAYLMNPRPRNFKQGKFKLTTTQNLIPSDDDLLRTISRGMPGSAMPPWGHLPPSDLRALVVFIRTTHTDAIRQVIEAGVKDGSFEEAEVPALLATRTQPGPPIVVPPEPKTDDLRWFNGRRVYLQACAACHGADGHPLPEAVKYDDEGYPDPPRSFVNGIFKGGMEGSELYCRIMKGMRGTPMPAYEGTYTNEEIWDLIHYVQSLARAGSQGRAQLQQGTFSAPNVSGPLPAGPQDSAWSQARPLFVAMTPLWWVDARIDGLVVQALHNGTEIALRLTWLDATQDDRAVRVDEFRDAVAIQFALSSDPPFYMGDSSQHGGVNIWLWKADRQKNINDGYKDVDAAFPQRVTDMYPESSIRAMDMSSTDWPHGAIAEHNPTFITAWGAGNLVADPTLKTPVECLVARGPGTLSGKPANVQTVLGQAIFERGMWTVQLQRPMNLPHDPDHRATEADERVFHAGDYLPVSFAIWNGSAGDRDGTKNISIWQKLVIE